jgi:hypothetical protein
VAMRRVGGNGPITMWVGKLACSVEGQPLGVKILVKPDCNEAAEELTKNVRRAAVRAR